MAEIDNLVGDTVPGKCMESLTSPANLISPCCQMIQHPIINYE